VGRLLQPFQRRGTPRSGDGLGLGLSIVQAIAVAHGGGLTLTPRPGGGLTAELTFPAVGSAWPGWRGQESQGLPAQHRGRPVVRTEPPVDALDVLADSVRGDA
jgi:hypothetical protein